MRSLASIHEEVFETDESGEYMAPDSAPITITIGELRALLRGLSIARGRIQAMANAADSVLRAAKEGAEYCAKSAAAAMYEVSK